MSFDVQTITYKGAQLLASATAADKLIIDGCDATAVALTEDQALAVTTRPASPLSNTTEVTQLGSTAEHVQARVYFHSGVSTGGNANTLYLYGHTESAPSDVFVIFVCSSATSFHLPEIGDVIDEWETDVDIVYTVSTDSVGFATQATYCSLSEFNLLKNRTVTTHKEGDTTAGDNQTILGEKTFSNTVNFSNFVLPTRSRSVDLGTDSKAFNVLYAVQVTSEGFTLQNDVSDPNQGIVQFGIYGFYPSFAYDIGHANYKFQNAYFSGTVNAGFISVAGNILPTDTNTVDVGSSTYQFKDAYFSGTVKVSSISSASNVIILVNDIKPAIPSGINCGSSSYPFAKGYFGEARVDTLIASTSIYPIPDNMVDLGTSSYSFKNLYLKGGIYGFPELSVDGNDAACSIGATMFIYINYGSGLSSQKSLSAGSIVKVGTDGVTAIKLAEMHFSTSTFMFQATSKSLTGYQFKLLCDAVFEAGIAGGFALAACVGTMS